MHLYIYLFISEFDSSPIPTAPSEFHHGSLTSHSVVVKWTASLCSLPTGQSPHNSYSNVYFVSVSLHYAKFKL